MARGQRKRNQRRRSEETGTRNDIWSSPIALPELEPIAMPTDVGAMLRSLGDPPLQHGVAAAYYFNTVVERASGVALALALSADLVEDDD